MINNQILPKEKTIHISRGTGKLERFKLIGTNTKTNPFCIISNSKEKDIFKRVKKFVNKDYKNNNHMINICKICDKNPMTTFALWTKRKDIIKGFFKHNKKPSNLIMVYSNPKVNQILETPPKYFDKVFNNVTSGAVNCSPKRSACLSCLKCYKFSKSEKNNIIIEQVKKAGGRK